MYIPRRGSPSLTTLSMRGVVLTYKLQTSVAKGAQGPRQTRQDLKESLLWLGANAVGAEVMSRFSDHGISRMVTSPSSMPVSGNSLEGSAPVRRICVYVDIYLSTEHLTRFRTKLQPLRRSHTLHRYSVDAHIHKYLNIYIPCIHADISDRCP